MANAKSAKPAESAEPVEQLFDGRAIVVRGAREHNLKNVDLTIPRDKLVVFTGLSGSGKSSLAFDTIYAEGQRRYVESLSAYARQFLEMMQKPDVDQIDGLSPAIAIEQKTTSKNPRSTVGTVTEIHDYMRLLWARVGVPYSPATGLPIESQTVSQMVDRVLALPERTRLYLLAPVVRGRKGEYRKEIADYMKRGFQRLKIDGEFYEIADAPALDKKLKHDIEVVVDRIVVRPDMASRLAESFETALELADGLAVVEFADPAAEGGEPRRILFSSKFACPVSGFTIPEIEPRLFSFNNPFGACPACGGLGSRADGRSRSRRPRPAADACAKAPSRPGRSRARPITSRRSRRWGGTTSSASIRPGRACRRRRGRHPQRLGRRGRPLRLRRRPALLRGEEAVRGRRQQPRSPLPRDRERMVARGDRALHDRDAVRGLPRLPPEARGAGGEDRRPAHRRGQPALGQGGGRLGARAAPGARRASATRSPIASSRRSATG